MTDDTKKCPLLSIVVPAYNEALNLPTSIAVLLQQTRPLCGGIEIVVVNDGSRDDTAKVLDRLAVDYPEVQPVHFSRNFGKEAALEAGLERAAGDAVLFIDADMQHPPSLIPEMIDAWSKGADVVNARKRDRGEEHALYGMASRLFYRLFAKAAGVNFQGASDYKLVDRQVVEAIKACQEKARFFRGLVAWVGFSQTELLFDVQPRAAGASAWSTYGLLKYSVRNLISFSSLPLTSIAIVGFIMAALSLVLCAETLFRYLIGKSLSGFTTVIVFQTVFSAAILFAIGVLAIYVARIYEEQKGRPLYLVRNQRRQRPERNTIVDRTEVGR